MKQLSVRGILAGLLVAVIAAVCIRLGMWQLDRLDQRRARNADVVAALAVPPLLLDSSAAMSVAADPAAFQYRRARAAGVWDQSASLLLRGRARGGSPGVHLVTPLRLEDTGVAVLVDRGWLPAADAATADPRPYREPGRVLVEGMIRLPVAAPATAERRVDVEFDGVIVPTYQRLDPSRLQPGFDVAILPFYLERAAAADGEVAPPFGATAPALDEGPHLGYAIQWFAFAAIAVIGFAVVVMRPGRGPQPG